MSMAKTTGADYMAVVLGDCHNFNTATENLEEHALETLGTEAVGIHIEWDKGISFWTLDTKFSEIPQSQASHSTIIKVGSNLV